MEGNKARRVLVDKLIELGTKATRPGVCDDARKASQHDFDELVKQTGTSTLIQTLTFLIQPGRVPPELRTTLLDVLTRAPLRTDGVRATVEFVFSVHPSSTVSSAEEAAPQKNGANITQEALNLAAKMIAYPPASVSHDTWYQAVAPQLFVLLDGEDGMELMKVAAYVIGFGILGRKQSGAIGTAGWEAIAEPILRPINPSLGFTLGALTSVSQDTNDVVDLSKSTILFTADQLAKALHRLQALLLSHPNPSLSKRLLHSVILPLWALGSWPYPPPQCLEKYCQPAQNLLKIYLKITAGSQGFQTLLSDLLYNGNSDQHMRWKYESTKTGEISVVEPRAFIEDVSAQIAWDTIDSKVDSLIDLIKSICSEGDIASIFSNLFASWFASNSDSSDITTSKEAGADRLDPFTSIIQVKVLQQMMNEFPSQISSRSDSLLTLIEPILSKGADSMDDETIPVALSLVNTIITAPSFQKSRMPTDVIQSIESSLEHLGSAQLGDSSLTARNLSLLMRYRGELDDPSDTSTAPTQRQVDDRKTYDLALSYITQADSPPPVRAEGLNLLQTLITQNSPTLDIPATLVLMSSLLQDDEDYIHLKVIKIFTQLANKHPKTVTKELLERYTDSNEIASIDTRLRFGEALLQVVERLGETFTGETARQVAESLLSTAGRRGYRPKTEEKQKKDERLRQMKQKRAEQEWGGQVPDLADDETEEEQANKELLTQIVGGWDSKHGSEDIRIRASALSIFAIGIETNLAGLGPSLVTAGVDLSVNVLTMEPGAEAGILRRSAVLVILSFVRALKNAKDAGRRLGFGLTQDSQEDIKRVLKYISETDNDGLVRQHARDVVESLVNWTLGSLVSETRAPDSTLSRLAGLSVQPGETTVSSGTSLRPRIQELD
ncbi:hypothetical protein M406DRAFT_291014 [Cryphonectria parasitica EP155]|uniref:RNA polymerase II assembly factor Rtp1 C-terminal domain-containing protein n=1 Tax=Cryphonectria parasitica (strain ATCC 38755 / EP155) TaxID=660469 RepID=A0A9P5CQX4_CRYP1|nr:uncharacterized protein M406DRAFT_291014 [Cryphonectria parasitica EP155]KAF3766535.1 hypothetical protein M406DRAFT_291014 [Cryphonectria parasitica EP155]